MGDVVEQIRCGGSFVSLEEGIVVLKVGSSRTFVEGRGVVIIHVVKLEL